jgi:starch synthase
VAVRIAFDSSLARRFYAGADLFLMPSLFEPCGLAQMIAMRYGALPVVRHTGGLRDTVTPFDPQTGRGNGFAFQAINPRDFLNAVLAARDLYAGDRASWRQAVGNAMREDFSWDRSAAAYRKLYLSLRD